MKVNTSTQTHRHMSKPFNIDSELDDRELKTWCQLHWQHIICKGVSGNNAPTYHDCCISFTRRGCVKKVSHPSIQSASILKIPTLRYSNTHEDLYRWLKGRLKMHHRLGNKTYFPSINTAHYTTEDDSGDDPEEQLEVLGKRYSKLMEDYSRLRDENDKLNQSNKSLVKASQNWCTKYQELLLEQPDDTPSYAETTPLKSMQKKELEDLIKL